MARRGRKEMVTIQVERKKRKGSPRPHMRTHPDIIKHRWTKENHPTHGRRPKPHVLISTALVDGLSHDAVVDGKPSGITVAEAIASAQLVNAMNGDLDAANFVAERSEGKVSAGLMNPNGPVKEIAFRIIYDEPAIDVNPEPERTGK